jgi:hypothetical protein
MLLRHLIVLMIDVREINSLRHMIRKTIYACRMHPILQASIGTEASMLQDEQLSNTFPLHNDKQRYLSSLTQSNNQQNLNFPGRFLTKQEAGGACRDRTDDLKLAKLPLSQLS